MCGIWGFKILNGKPKKEIINKIIQLADNRGGHCNGFYSIDKQNYHFLYKKHGKANIDEINNLVIKSSIVIGHSRLATNSDINIFNSQPIVTKNSILVHNGIIKNYKEIYLKEQYIPVTENDSEALILLIKQQNMPEQYAYLLIEFDDINFDIKYGSKGLPLFKKEYEGVIYFCSINF
jgi:glucosamine 6-phosphate synthetase-like amidotransferase/phosphosugar isomerase protein